MCTVPNSVQPGGCSTAPETKYPIHIIILSEIMEGGEKMKKDQRSTVHRVSAKPAASFLLARMGPIAHQVRRFERH